MQKPAGLNKKRKMTEELFNKIKTVLQNIEGKKNFESIGQILNCSNTTVRRVDSVTTWSEFKKNIEKRSPRRAQQLKKVSEPKKEDSQPQLFETATPQMVINLDGLINIVNHLVCAIEHQTVAIDENTKVYKSLRDRMAVANTLKARELLNATKQQLAEMPAKEGAAQ